MDGLEWKTLLKWMIWGYHYFPKHPSSNSVLSICISLALMAWKKILRVTIRWWWYILRSCLMAWFHSTTTCWIYIPRHSIAVINLGKSCQVIYCMAVQCKIAMVQFEFTPSHESTKTCTYKILYSIIINIYIYVYIISNMQFYTWI